MPKKATTLPKTLALCADRLYQLKALKSEAQKVVDGYESEYQALKAHLIASLPKSDASGVAGKTCRVGVVVKLIPTIADWDKFTAYVAKNKAWDLIHRRVSTAACAARWDDGKKVDGIAQESILDLSVHKV